MTSNGTGATMQYKLLEWKRFLCEHKKGNRRCGCIALAEVPYKDGEIKLCYQHIISYIEYYEPLNDSLKAKLEKVWIENNACEFSAHGEMIHDTNVQKGADAYELSPKNGDGNI